MSYIKVTLDHPIEDGERLTFKAPINSTAATGIKVYYPVNNGEAAWTMTSAVFTIIDACGTSLQETASIFTAGAYVSVLLDTTNMKAYMLNNNIHIAAYDTAIAALQTAVANLQSKTREVVLFSGDHEMTTDDPITLSQSAAGFEYIDIQYSFLGLDNIYTYKVGSGNFVIRSINLPNVESLTLYVREDTLTISGKTFKEETSDSIKVWRWSGAANASAEIAPTSGYPLMIRRIVGRGTA